MTDNRFSEGFRSKDGTGKSHTDNQTRKPGEHKRLWTKHEELQHKKSKLKEKVESFKEDEKLLRSVSRQEHIADQHHQARTLAEEFITFADNNSTKISEIEQKWLELRRSDNIQLKVAINLIEDQSTYEQLQNTSITKGEKRFFLFRPKLTESDTENEEGHSYSNKSLKKDINDDTTTNLSRENIEKKEVTADKPREEEELKQIETSLLNVSRELESTAGIVMSDEKQHPRTIKEKVENMYKIIKSQTEFLKLKYNGVIRVVDQGKISGLSRIRQLNEYSSLKDLRPELEQISTQIRRIDEDKNIDKDLLLKDLAEINKKIFHNYEKIRGKFQDREIKEEYRQKGKKIFEYAKNKSVERQGRGMTKSVVEKSWKSFYDSSIRELKPDSLKRKEFDELMEKGWIKGKESDYYVIVMEPKLPDNSRPFDGPLQPLVAYVNPKDGVLINFRANREIEQQWRKENFPEEFSQQWIKNLEIGKPPKEFFEPLQASDLSSFACRLAREKYKEEHSSNDLSLPTFTQVVGSYIFSPESTLLLYEHMEPGKSIIFKPEDEGFDLISATHFGRRVPFIQADYPDIIEDGTINHYEMLVHSPDDISIKSVVNPKD